MRHVAIARVFFAIENLYLRKMLRDADVREVVEVSGTSRGMGNTSPRWLCKTAGLGQNLDETPLSNYNRIFKKPEPALGSQNELLWGLERAHQCVLRLRESLLRLAYAVLRAAHPRVMVRQRLLTSRD